MEAGAQAQGLLSPLSVRLADLQHTCSPDQDSEVQQLVPYLSMGRGMPGDSWGDLQLSSHPTALIPNHSPPTMVHFILALIRDLDTGFGLGLALPWGGTTV